MARILAIDYGQKRVGLAVTDPTGTIANGLDTLHPSQVMDFLEKYMEKEKVETLVVGYPRTLRNTPSEAAALVNPFVRKLKEKYPSLRVELQDERFTSSLARQALLDGGASKKQRRDKALVDRISAVIILQAYLERIVSLKAT